MTPKRIYVGDLVEIGINSTERPPADGWTLKLCLTPRFTTPVQAAITLTATPNGTIDGTAYDYVISALPATTTAWKAGQYGWGCWVEKSGARKVLEGTQYQGELTALPDPSVAAQGADLRSQAQKAVEDLKAWLAGLASAGSTAGAAVLERRIGDRAVKYSTAEEARAGIVKMLNYWEGVLESEAVAERLSHGLRSPRRLQVRF